MTVEFGGGGADPARVTNVPNRHRKWHPCTMHSCKTKGPVQSIKYFSGMLSYVDHPSTPSNQCCQCGHNSVLIRALVPNARHISG